jgi:hypothetical protein
MIRGMSAIGPKQTSLVAMHMSAFGGKADIDFVRPCYVTVDETYGRIKRYWGHQCPILSSG